MGKITVLYESQTGCTEKMAALVAEGARSIKGMEVRLVSVHDEDAAEAVSWADGLAVGTPTNLGGISWRMKKFWDDWSPSNWSKVDGKFGCTFSSQGGHGGGAELTCTAMNIVLMNFGFLVFGVTDYLDSMHTLHYGACIAKEPRREVDKDVCRRLGLRLAEWVSVYFDQRPDLHPLLTTKKVDGREIEAKEDTYAGVKDKTKDKSNKTSNKNSSKGKRSTSTSSTSSSGGGGGGDNTAHSGATSGVSSPSGASTPSAAAAAATTVTTAATASSAAPTADDWKGPVHLIVRVSVPKECRAAWEAKARELTAFSRQERGCVRYNFAQIEGSETEYYVVEEYTSVAALNTHSNAAYFKRLVPEMGKLSSTLSVQKVFPLHPDTPTGRTSGSPASGTAAVQAGSFLAGAAVGAAALFFALRRQIV